VDRGRFSGHVQPCRRERRSGSEDSLGNRADSLGNRVRRSREPGRFSEESRRHTSLFYRQFFRTTPCFGSIQSDYSRLTIYLRQPGPGHGRRLRWRRRGRKAFGTIWLPGIMGTRGLAAGARAAPPTTSTSLLPTAPRLKPDRTVSCFPGEEHEHREPGRHRVAFERRLLCAVAGHFPDHRPSSRPASRKQEPTRRCPAGRHAPGHPPDHCCQRWCRCAGHSRSRR